VLASVKSLRGLSPTSIYPYKSGMRSFMSSKEVFSLSIVLNLRTMKVCAALSKPLLAGLLVMAVVLLQGGTVVAADQKNAAQGKVLADSGFRPKPNGFGFENWGGDQHPISKLTAEDVQAFFGDRVCARFDKNQCVLTPAAKLWAGEMNKMMEGGHCEGMAALSAAFHVKKEAVTDYGAPQTFDLQPKKADLMRTISMYFATQALEPVNKSTSLTREWALQKIIDQLVSAIGSKTDYITLGIYGAQGGHAVTPYMVEQLPSGVHRIYVYDNNYPGAEKYVDVDVAKDRWTYAGAALNPKEDPAPWEGGSGSMDVTLLSTRYEPLQCPFCGDHRPPKNPPPQQPSSSQRKPSIQSDGYTVVTPARCSQVQATRKSDKKQISSAKNGAKAEISGATMTSLRGSRGCIVRLPRDQQYDVALVSDGSVVTPGNVGITIFYPGSVYSVSNVALTASAAQTFSLSKDNFSYIAGGTQKPTVRIAEDRDGPNTLYEVSGFTIEDGKSFGAVEGEDGQITFYDNDSKLDMCDISAEVIDESGTSSYDLDDVDFGDNGRVVLHAEDNGDLDVDIDSDGDGTVDDLDTDDDNDGTLDAKDSDDDNDGVADDKEGVDSDGDSIPDSKDNDDDNDGELDASDSDGLSRDAGDTDSDNDGVVDEADTDDDNDGVSDDKDSDDDNDGTPDASDPDSADDDSDDEDSDHDGVADEADADDDNDGVSDEKDSDDDNDGTPDASDPDSADSDDEDSDHDSVADEVDADDDNDGVADEADTDDDNDGVPDVNDEDSAGDDHDADDGHGHDDDAGGESEGDSGDDGD